MNKFDQSSSSNGGFVGAFIQRPITAGVLSLLIIIAGLASFFGVEVRELPDVDRPVVSIDTNYPGATPETVDAEVTAIIESAVATVAGIESVSSSSGFGDSDVTLEFSSSIDIDIAATDVQNAISSIVDELPEEIELPRVRKADSNGSAMMRISVFAAEMDPGDLARLVDDVIVPRLQAVEGVAQADPYGDRNKLIRIRVHPVSLAARGYTVDDVARVAQTAAQSTPSGRLRNDTQQILIRAEAPATTPEEIAALRLDSETKLSDVAVVEWGYESETRTARINGVPGVGIAIVRQAQSNTMAVSAGVREAVAELDQSLPPNVEINVSVDDSILLRLPSPKCSKAFSWRRRLSSLSFIFSCGHSGQRSFQLSPSRSRFWVRSARFIWPDFRSI